MEAEWLANIGWLMEPHEACQKRTHDNCQSVQFQGRDDKVLSGARPIIQGDVYPQTAVFVLSFTSSASWASVSSQLDED